MIIDGVERIGKDASIRSFSSSLCSRCVYFIGLCTDVRVNRYSSDGYIIVEKCNKFTEEMLTIRQLREEQAIREVEADDAD